MKVILLAVAGLLAVCLPASATQCEFFFVFFFVYGDFNYEGGTMPILNRVHAQH